ncbi:MAG: histidine kinase [Chitinophagales bacterium]
MPYFLFLSLRQCVIFEVMTQFSKKPFISRQELLFQLLLHFVVFIFFSFDKNQPQIEGHQYLFFLNYAVCVFLINYVFLPRFYYQKKYLLFTIGVITAVGIVICIEEFVLEKIFFPTTKGKHFSGLFYALLDVLPVITILSGFKFAWDALVKQRELDDLKAAIEDSELQFLKSQINPHFLFNNLNNLYAYAIESSPKTPAIILELSSVLRYMLYECKENFVLLSKEIDQMENFTRLNELQIEERGTVNFNTPNTTNNYQIAPLILIVFIENAFKHSTASQSKDIFIDIHIELSDEGILEFVCINSFQNQTNTENLSHGIGLKNVQKRLELLYPNSHQLEIEEKEGRYEVRLKLQLCKKTI